MAKPISPGPSAKNPKAPKHGAPIPGKNPRFQSRDKPMVGKGTKAPKR